MLKRILVIFAVLVLLLFLGGFLLPRDVHVERSIVIDAPQERIFTLVNSFERFNEWSPWAAHDPSTHYTYEGPPSGVGAKMTWTSDHPKVGSGSQEIVESTPPRWVKTALDFGEQGTAHATFALLEDGDAVRVTWGLDTDVGANPAARYFGLFFDGMIGPDYEKGLADLKTLAESMKDEPPPIEVTIETVEADTILFVSGEAEPKSEKISKALGEAYGKVMTFMQDKGVEAKGPPIAITRAWEKERYAFDAALPIETSATPETSGDVKKGETYAGQVVRAVHKGPYEEIKPVYESIQAFMKAKGLQENGNSWETYVNDPTKTPPEELLTHVYFPVKPASAPEPAPPPK